MDITNTDFYIMIAIGFVHLIFKTNNESMSITFKKACCFIFFSVLILSLQ